MSVQWEKSDTTVGFTSCSVLSYNVESKQINFSCKTDELKLANN